MKSSMHILITQRVSLFHPLCLFVLLTSQLPSLATSPGGHPMPGNPMYPSNPVTQPVPSPQTSPVARPAGDLFYIDQADDGTWSAVHPSDWEIKFSRSEFSGVTYTTVLYFDIRVHGVDVANVGDAGSYFFSPSQNTWWQTYSTYGAYYYSVVSDPTSGVINPNSLLLSAGGGGADGNESYETGFEQGFEEGVKAVLSDPESYDLYSKSAIPGVRIAARRGTQLSIAITGNWRRYVASGVPRGWRFDNERGLLSGTVQGDRTITLRATRGSTSAPPLRFEVRSNNR